MHRIAWRSTVSNSSGNGEFILTEVEAKLWVRKLNNRYPCIIHWYETQKPTLLNLKGLNCSYGDPTFTVSRAS